MEARARAPSSTANLGPGFDVFGLALDAYHDTVSVRDTDGPGITMSADGGVPSDPSRNTAGMVISAMQGDFGARGVHIAVYKGVPAGYGMGSSAASAAAAAVAYDELRGLGLDRDELVRYAGYGEQASAGSIHYDNVAAAVCGGFVAVRTGPLRVTGMAAPRDLVVCLAVPRMAIPDKKTQVSRGVVPGSVPLVDVVANLASASCMVAGFLKGDVDLIGDSMRDVIVEPARKHMVPGFDAVREMAVAAGAAGVAISGAGPSVVAFARDTGNTPDIMDAMERGFESAGVKCDTISCRPAGGAHTVESPGGSA